jgi:predicted small lipoprotein YifL
LTLLAARQNVRAMRTALVLVLSLSALSACGLRGELVRPEPMWGNPPDEGPLDPRNIRKAEEEAAAREAQEEAERAAREREAVTPPQ